MEVLSGDERNLAVGARVVLELHAQPLGQTIPALLSHSLESSDPAPMRLSKVRYQRVHRSLTHGLVDSNHQSGESSKTLVAERRLVMVPEEGLCNLTMNKGTLCEFLDPLDDSAALG